MELFYKKEGQGQPLLILHGLFGSLDNWQTLARQLAADFTVYIIDQRNHGRSPHSEEWNYEVMAADLKELMDKEKLDNAYLLGHSMGGKTVMKFASIYPTMVRKMIVADISPAYYPVHHRPILDALLSLNLDNISSRSQAEAELKKTIEDTGTLQFLLKNLYWTDTDPKMLRWRFNLEVINRKIQIVGEALEYAGDPDIINDLPVLFISGERSNYIKEGDKALIRKMYPSSRLISLADAGHWVHAEKPDDFLNAVREFLKGNQ